MTGSQSDSGEMLIASSESWLDARELGGWGKRDSDSGVRALVLTLSGSDTTRSKMGLCIPILLCRPSSALGSSGLSNDWEQTVGPGVLGVAGPLLKNVSAGEGNDIVLTLEPLRLRAGLRQLAFDASKARGESNIIDWKGMDVATLSRGLGKGEFTCELSGWAKVGVRGVVGCESKAGLVGDGKGLMMGIQ